MSYAIFDLELEMPPVSVIHVRRDGVLYWIARCELCGKRGTARPMLSVALRFSYDHGRTHAAVMLRLASTGSPAVVPRRPRISGQPLAAKAVPVSRSKVTRRDVA